jgi:hypothetical protein
MWMLIGKLFGYNYSKLLKFYGDNATKEIIMSTIEQLTDALGSNVHESISEVSIYKTALSSSTKSNAKVMYHTFLVLETPSHFYSLEKNNSGVIFQQSSTKSDVLNTAANIPRPEDMHLVISCDGNSSVLELISHLWKSHHLTDNGTYSLLTENCKSFVADFFNKIAKEYQCVCGVHTACSSKYYDDDDKVVCLA